MPTQLEYGIRRTACVRELEKRMYSGHSHHFTGPKSYYPDKVMNSSPPPKPLISLIEEGMEKLTLDDVKELTEFAVSFGKSVRQHTVRDKSEEDTGHLPYPVSFSLQQREPGSNFLTSTLRVKATRNKWIKKMCFVVRLSFSVTFCLKRRKLLL